MTPIDLLSLDRELRRAADHALRWRRRLESGQGYDEDPFEPTRGATGLSTFSLVRELPPEEPLREPILRFVYRLAEQRINRAAIATCAHAVHAALHHVDAPERGEHTFSMLVKQSLADSARRSVWLEQLFSNAGTAHDSVAALWERRSELAHKMGLESPDVIERACPQSEVVADAWLRESEGTAREVCPPVLSELFEVALARDAADGWPARLTLRSLGEILRADELFAGLSLDPGRFPEPLGGASFLRGFARLGAAFAEAAAPRHQPFVIAHDPYGLERRRSGALFGLLPLSLPFLKKNLGLSPQRAKEHRRALARSALIESRLLALRLLLRKSALRSRTRLSEDYRELVARTFGFDVPKEAAGTLIRLHIDDDQRFSGLLLGVARDAELVAKHDDDYFRNPRAIEQLRGEAELSPRVAVGREELESCVALLATRLNEALV